MRKIGELMESAIKGGNTIFAYPLENEAIGAPKSLCKEPKSWESENHLVSHLLYETDYDAEKYPHVQYCEAKNCHLVDDQGNVVGSSSIFVVDTTWGDIEEYHHDVDNICLSLDDIREDLSGLYYHPWVREIQKKTEVVIFVDHIKVADESKSKGIGKWLFGAAISDALENDQKNVVIALMISPTGLGKKDDDDDGVINYAQRDEEAYKIEGERLLHFYEKAFKEIAKSDQFAECDITYRVDTDVGNVTAVAVWTATKIKEKK